MKTPSEMFWEQKERMRQVAKERARGPDFSYTKEELERFKSTLPEKLQDAVDMLTVTVSEAKKVLKNDN